MSGLKWSSLEQSYTRCLIVLLMLQISQILGEKSQILGEESQIFGENQDKLNAVYTWIDHNVWYTMPDNAVLGGYENNGSAIYVGRYNYGGSSLPAKVVPAELKVYYSYNHTVSSGSIVEVLVRNRGKFEWVNASNGSVPPNAVVAGNTDTGEILYVGRTLHSGSKLIGKIQPSDGCLYIVYKSKEIASSTYEVLVYSLD